MRFWPQRRVWLQAGLGVGMLTYSERDDTGDIIRRERLGQGFAVRAGGGVELRSLARVSLGVSFVVDGFFQSSTSVYAPVLAVSLRYYTGLGSRRSSRPCNFDPSKGCTN